MASGKVVVARIAAKAEKPLAATPVVAVEVVSVAALVLAAEKECWAASGTVVVVEVVLVGGLVAAAQGSLVSAVPVVAPVVAVQAAAPLLAVQAAALAALARASSVVVVASPLGQREPHPARVEALQDSVQQASFPGHRPLLLPGSAVVWVPESR